MLDKCILILGVFLLTETAFYFYTNPENKGSLVIIPSLDRWLVDRWLVDWHKTTKNRIASFTTAATDSLTPIDRIQCDATIEQSYRQLHNEILCGKRSARIRVWEGEGARAGGLGDRFRGMLHMTYSCGMTGYAGLFNWLGPSNKTADGSLDRLQHMFVPRKVFWNSTVVNVDSGVVALAEWELQQSKHLKDLASKFWFLRGFAPLGIAHLSGESEVVNATEVSPEITHIFHSDDVYQKLQYFNPRNTALGRNDRGSLKDFELYNQSMPQIIRTLDNTYPSQHSFQQILQATEEDDIVTNGDLLVKSIRKRVMLLSFWERGACGMRLLFDTLAAPLRSRFFLILLRLAEDYVANRGHKSSSSSTAISDAPQCVGLTLSQCLTTQLGLQHHSPVIGIHFRVGDIAMHSGRDKRTDRSLIGDVLRCAGNLSQKLGFVNPTFMFLSDDEQLRATFRSIAGEVKFLVPHIPKVVHVDRNGKGMIPTLDTMAEVLTLATADALVLTHSGFGNLASFFSGLPSERQRFFEARSFEGTCYKMPRRYTKFSVLEENGVEVS